MPLLAFKSTASSGRSEWRSADAAASSAAASAASSSGSTFEELHAVGRESLIPAPPLRMSAADAPHAYQPIKERRLRPDCAVLPLRELA